MSFIKIAVTSIQVEEQLGTGGGTEELTFRHISRAYVLIFVIMCSICNTCNVNQTLVGTKYFKLPNIKTFIMLDMLSHVSLNDVQVIPLNYQTISNFKQSKIKISFLTFPKVHEYSFIW